MSRSGESATDFERVAELFTEILETSPRERSALLQAAASDSPEVAAEVESLLAAHDRSSDQAAGILDADLDPTKAVGLMEDSAPTSLPQQIGPYKIARELGRGGMGVVYLAERTEGGFEQRVALKLVKRGMDSEAILARFLRERQILARLDHPGIARLFDGGLTIDGRPYFAMEHAEAEPITDYSTRGNLSLNARLSLFSEACRAVQYAHGRLVVHRDLKPSNVLVTADGAVKLVDFGIAKVLDATAGKAAATGLTAHGSRALTPEYASPEQIRGEAVTVGSDVYALGVLLYELLVERSPYLVPLTTPEEIRRAVCETEPQPPSAAVLGTASNQGAELQRRAMKMRGDLDRVVLKALAKEPEQRYQSVEALAEDLQRFRDGLPIRARRAGWVYRANKFVGRHRVGVAAASAAVLALVFGLAATTWQAATAARERDKARLESDKLRATQEYLFGLFEAATPAEALGEELTAKEVVTQGVERLGIELAGQPEVRLEMLAALSEVSAALGDYEQTESLLGQNLKLARQLHGESHLTVADALTRIGRSLNARGAWAEAEGRLRDALSIYSRLASEDNVMVPEAQSSLAASLRRQGDLAGAIALHRAALETARRLYGDRSEPVAAFTHDMALALKAAGNFEAAEEAIMETLAINRALEGPEHPDVATNLVNLAGVLARKGDWLGAEPYYRDGIAMERRLRGEQHPRFAIKLHNLATHLARLGRYEEAARLHREVLVSVQENMGVASPYYATAVDSLASDLAEAGHYEEAMPLFAQARHRLLNAVGVKHEFYAIHLWRHASALHLQGLDQPAVPLIEEAISVARDLKSDRLLGTMLADRGTIHMTLGAVEAAESDFREALQTQRETLPPNHPSFVGTMSGLGWVLIACGEPSEAATVLREAAALADRVLPKAHWRRAEARAALGAALMELEQRADGELLLREGHQRLMESRGPTHPGTRRATTYLG